MKITHNKIGQNLNLRESSKDLGVKGAKGDVSEVAESTSGKAASKTDASANVSLSAQARDIKKIKEQIAALPDVDEAKVAKFQSLIDSGKYKVSADKIADRMVDEHLMTGD